MKQLSCQEKPRNTNVAWRYRRVAWKCRQPIMRGTLAGGMKIRADKCPQEAQENSMNNYLGWEICLSKLFVSLKMQ